MSLHVSKYHFVGSDVSRLNYSKSIKLVPGSALCLNKQPFPAPLLAKRTANQVEHCLS